MFRNGFITSWPALLQAIESHFAPSIYNDPHEALFKLIQRGIVTEYLTEFEKLANPITRLSSSVLLSCFISGLSPKYVVRYKLSILYLYLNLQLLLVFRKTKLTITGNTSGPYLATHHQITPPPLTLTLPRQLDRNPLSSKEPKKTWPTGAK